MANLPHRNERENTVKQTVKNRYRRFLHVFLPSFASTHSSNLAAWARFDTSTPIAVLMKTSLVFFLIITSDKNINIILRTYIKRKRMLQACSEGMNVLIFPVLIADIRLLQLGCLDEIQNQKSNG